MQRREVSRNGGNFFVLRFYVDAKYKSIMIGEPPPPRPTPPKKTLLCNPFKFHGVSYAFLNSPSVFPIASFSRKRPVAQSSDTKCLLGKRLFITVKVSYVMVPVASPVGYIS